MTEVLPFVIVGFCALVLVLALGGVALVLPLLKAERKGWEAERRTFLAMIRDLQDRLSAKDLNGYMAISPGPPSQSSNGASTVGGSDEEEAAIEQEHRRLFPEMFQEPRASEG